MKDLGEASYILGIKLLRDRRNKVLGLTQTSYIDKILVKACNALLQERLLTFSHGISLCKD